MNLPPILSNIFSGGIEKVLGSVKGIIDESKFSSEEKAELEAKITEALNSHNEKMTSIAQAELESYLKDTQSARDANSRIQESENASWLAKNVAYCLDIFIVAVWGFLTIYLLCTMLNIVKKQEGVDYTAVTAVWGGVTAFAGTVIQFHRGSSRSSEEKQKKLNQMITKNQ